MHKQLLLGLCYSAYLLPAASVPLDKKEMIQQLISAHPGSLLADIDVTQTLKLFKKKSDYQDKLLQTVSAYVDHDEPRILTPALIDSLIEQAEHATCSQEYMRSMLARCSLCLAERINFADAKFWQIQVMEPYQCMFYAPCEAFASKLNFTGITHKAIIMHQLLCALQAPQKTNDNIVHLFLHALGCKELCNTSDTDEIPTAINGPLPDDGIAQQNEIESENASKFFWQDARIKLTFIKQLVPFMAPTDAKSSARKAYFLGLIHPFIRDTKKRSRNEELAPAYYIHSNTGKIALVLEYLKTSDILTFTHWRFDLFHDMQG